MKRPYLKSTLLIAASLTLSTLLTGCLETTSSDNVKPEAVYQSYSVTYNPARDLISASASFTVGGPLGTSLSLKSPSRVSFNGLAMRESNILGTSYSASTAGPLSPTHSFLWVDQNGKSYTNSITIQTFAIAHRDVSWNVTGPTTIHISGPSAQSDTFYASLEQGQKYESLEVSALDSSRLSLRIYDLARSQLTSGTAWLKIQRKRYAPLSESTAGGGGISATYEIGPIEVQIIR